MIAMKREFRITKKPARKGEGGHKIVSVRMKDETFTRPDDLSVQTNRSRNELINLLLEAARFRYRNGMIQARKSPCLFVWRKTRKRNRPSLRRLP